MLAPCLLVNAHDQVSVGEFHQLPAGNLRLAFPEGSCLRSRKVSLQRKIARAAQEPHVLRRKYIVADRQHGLDVVLTIGRFQLQMVQVAPAAHTCDDAGGTVPPLGRVSTIDQASFSQVVWHWEQVTSTVWANECGIGGAFRIG